MQQAAATRYYVVGAEFGVGGRVQLDEQRLRADVGQVGSGDRGDVRVQRALEQLRADFVATLGRAQADGEINAQLNPEDLGNLLIVTAQGAALMSKVPENKSVAIGAMRGLLSTMEAA